MTRGDLVLVHFPFTDLSGQKLRPALILAPSSVDDMLVAFITSRVEHPPTAAEVLLAPDMMEFAGTGLKVSSVLRLDKLATLHRSLAIRRLGRIGRATAAAVSQSLRHVLDL